MTLCWHPTRQVSRRPHILWLAAALLSINVLCAARSGARDPQDEQGVAAAARQEKARKSGEANAQSHVYTNDDLRKSQILTEQDRGRIEARKKSGPPTETVEPGPSRDANADSSAESLGEVARRYRREKARDLVEQASRPKPPTAFLMDLSQPTFAAPAPVGPPLSALRAPLAPIAPSRAASRPRLGRAPLKRDPFSRPTLSPFSSAAHPGPAPLITAPVEPPPVAPRSEPAASSLVAPSATAMVPVKPAIVFPPPTVRGIAPGKPSMASPAAPPRPPALPPSSVAPTPSRDLAITVQPGDSLWKLSRRFLGAGSRWQDWLTVNPGLRDPQFIQAGAILLVPHGASSAVSRASGGVLVHQGDSLWRIALTQYGNGAEWQCIARANPALSDPGQIYPGQTLVLPVGCSPSQTSKPSRY
jgi:nucleoid-associated protein YgaU